MRPSLTRKLRAIRPVLIKVLEMHRNKNMTQPAIAAELNKDLKPGEKPYYQTKIHRLLREAEALDEDGLLYPRAVGSQLASNAHHNLGLPVSEFDEEKRRAAIEGLQYFREN
jgi:hypothetical protein